MTALRSFVNELGIFFEGRRVSCIVECGFRLVNRGIDWMKGAERTARRSFRSDCAYGNHKAKAVWKASVRRSPFVSSMPARKSSERQRRNADSPKGR